MNSACTVRLSVCAIAALAVVVLLAGCGSSHSRFQSHMERGKQYLAAGNLEKARVEFRNALQIEPRNVDAFYFSGRVAERRGEIREAVGFYEAAIDVQPDDTRARAQLAKALVLGGATQHAMEVIGPGLLNHPDDANLLAARAAARHEFKDDAEARMDAEHALRVDPANENAVAVLAALALRAGEAARAISLVTDAVSKAPDSIELHGILANLLLTNHQPLEAEEQMRKVIALEPKELAPRLELSNHFLQAHELEQAQRVLEQAVRDLPNTNAAKLALVDFVALQRSPKEGEKTLRDFLARAPDDAALRFALGALLQRAGAVQEAVSTYREIMRRDGLGPKGLAARDRIAAVAISQGHDAEATKLLDEVLTESAHDDDALIMRANIELARNDPTNAIVDLRAVLRDQPKSVVLQRTLARAYLAKGEPALAEEALRVALQASPEDVSVRIELAQFLMQTERVSQAVTLLEDTVQRVPQDGEAREALIRAYMASHDLTAARTAAEDLKRLQPQSAQGYYLAGLVAHDDNRLDESAKDLERALELQPGSLAILTTLTDFDLQRSRTAPAIARLQRALDRNPDSMQLLDLLVQTYLESNDPASASAALTRALQRDPRSWVAYRDLGRVRLAAADVNGAIETYQTAFRLAPTQLLVASELSSLYESQGRIDDAISCYEALNKSTDFGVRQFAANNLALLLVSHRTDSISLSRAHALTADFTTSQNASLLDTAGWVSFKSHEYREAVIILERAADRSPASKVIRYHLAMAQLRIGEKEHARRNLETALAGSASFTGAEEARAALASLKAARSG